MNTGLIERAGIGRPNAFYLCEIVGLPGRLNFGCGHFPRWRRLLFGRGCGRQRWPDSFRWLLRRRNRSGRHYNQPLPLRCQRFLALPLAFNLFKEKPAQYRTGYSANDNEPYLPKKPGHHAWPPARSDLTYLITIIRRMGRLSGLEHPALMMRGTITARRPGCR